MDVRPFCVKVYQDTLKHASINSELKRSLKAHERVPAFIDNLVSQVKRTSMTVTTRDLEMVVRDLSMLFFKCVQMAADEKQMSDLARMTIKQDQFKAEEFKAELERLEDSGNEKITLTEQGEIQRTEIRVD